MTAGKTSAKTQLDNLNRRSISLATVQRTL